jgi:hypothetical protein
VIKTVILPALAVVVAFSSIGAPGSAMAQQYDRPPPGYDRGPPPPPPRDRDRPRRHHRDNGGVIAGGIAAGVIGGLLGGAIVNGSGPRYAEPPPPPPPRCWFEDQRVRNAYDGGSHIESVRVCD